MEENINTPTQSSESLVHDFKGSSSVSEAFSLTPKIIAIFAGIVVLGLLSGFFVSKNKGGGVSQGVVTAGSVTKGTIVGSDDSKTFNDTAEGIMKKGGIEDEGTFHLVRPGGDSQNVYLTSSIVDMSLFIDRKVKVFGATQKAKTAGWLMDVGKIEVLE